MNLSPENYYWDRVVNRLQRSQNKLEADHMFLGTHAEYGYPILLHKALLKQHKWVVAGSGAGKTARAFAPDLTQIIRSGRSSVVVLDLKGEASLRETVRIEAERNKRIFKYFTNELGRPTYLFNPIPQLSHSGSISKFVETLMEALRLNYGDGYGSRYFSSQSRERIYKTVKRWPNLSSFAELYEKLQPDFLTEAEADRCREAISVIEQVASVTALNWKVRPGCSDRPLRDAIYMPDVVREGQVIYVSLPAAGETSTVREIGSLFLYSYFIAAKDAYDQGLRRDNHLYIDEVQQMASEGLKLILRQARYFNLSITMANQSESDLMTRQANRLLDVVRSNTQVKLFFSVDDPNTLQMLERGSGLLWDEEKLDYRPRLTINDIRRYSSHPDYCICWIARDSGFSTFGGDWFGMKTGYHIPLEEFERRDCTPWPAQTESTIIAKRDDESDPAVGRLEPAQIKLFGEGEAAAPKLIVPADSKWATRLNEVYARRFAGEMDRYEPE